MVPVCLICFVQQIMKAKWILRGEIWNSQCNSSTLIYNHLYLWVHVGHSWGISYYPVCPKQDKLHFFRCSSPFIRPNHDFRRPEFFQAWQSSKAPTSCKHKLLTSALLLVKCFRQVLDSLNGAGVTSPANTTGHPAFFVLSKLIWCLTSWTFAWQAPISIWNDQNQITWGDIQDLS